METYFYDELVYSCYGSDVMYVTPLIVKPPKAPKKLSKRRRYNDTTTPPLDFRLCPESPV